MDRFRWCSMRNLSHQDGEVLVIKQSKVRIYEGTEQTGYNNGVLQLTNFRLIWTDSHEPDTVCLALPLVAVVNAKAQSSIGWAGTPKLTLKLSPDATILNALRALSRMPRWAENWLDPSLSESCKLQANSDFDLIKFGFTSGTGHREFEQALLEQLHFKAWEVQKSAGFKVGGIGAIERAQAAKLAQTDKSINQAFSDLDQLMKCASEMVKLSRELSANMKKMESGEKDELEEFRNSMLEMGVEDAVKRGPDSGKSSSFHKDLARQICSLLLAKVKGEVGTSKNRKVQLDWSNSGCIELTTAYCRVNRARGLDLISPKDLLKATNLMESLDLPLRLKTLPSGVKILHMATENEEKTLQETTSTVESQECLSHNQFAELTGLAPILAKERLLMAEEKGLLCRDDSCHGLYFYPNSFFV
ncbi:Vacuolar protein-sorting-associated protein 36 [Cichlidogyrus casuarinus]|uniref:Vacuolar protein-sorting-associated protein 36 n=1 Tax=Cichlidogyrus casuarinus TaxID=1844966 RepID=A0ABD2Q665_9PLAT